MSISGKFRYGKMEMPLENALVDKKYMPIYIDGV